MKTTIQVLSEDERNKIHERSLYILENTSMQVETEKGRKILRKAGAQVDENTKIVRFPRNLIEDSLKTTTKKFTLGARRPGWEIEVNVGDCFFCGDGEAANVVDPATGERRPSAPPHSFLFKNSNIEANFRHYEGSIQTCIPTSYSEIICLNNLF